MMGIGKITMAVVCVIGIVAMEPEDYRPSVIFFNLAGIILLSVWCSFIAEEISSQRKKKRNAIRLGD